MHHAFMWILIDVIRQRYMITCNGNEILPSLNGPQSVLKKTVSQCKPETPNSEQFQTTIF
jgi:hypothetical protein